MLKLGITMIKFIWGIEKHYNNQFNKLLVHAYKKIKVLYLLERDVENNPPFFY